MDKPGVEQLLRFLAENCSLGSEERTSRAVLRDAYLKWCHERSLKPVGAKTIAGAIRDLGCSDSLGTDGIRCWDGISVIGAQIPMSKNQREAAVLARYVTERVLCVPDALITKVAVYADYVEWCQAQGLVPESQKRLSFALSRGCPGIRHTTTWDRAAEISVTSWNGLELRASGRGLQLRVV